MGIAPVAVFKHAISEPQLTKILASPAKEICMMYDSDATKSAWQEAAKLSSNRKASVAEMPEGVDANDNAVAALEAFVERHPYSAANSLISQFNSVVK
jgi:hypothetical protein